MKNNRKNRNLKFIREKNRLRTGKTKFYCTEKVSNSVKEGKSYWNRLIATANESLLKNYKLKLDKVVISTGLNDDDFVYDLHTNCVCLSLK